MGNNATCADRIKEALAMRDMTQADLCRATGIPTSAMSQYCNGTLTPRQKRTKVIADALSVSVGWLMGFDVPSSDDISNAVQALQSGMFTEPEIRRDDIPADKENMTEETSELLRIFNNLDIKGRTQLLAFAYELEAKQRSE